MDEIFYDISGSNTWKVIEPIKEGWSNDLKFHVIGESGAQFLLRISDSSSYEKEKVFYDALRTLNGIDIPISKLLTSGLCNNGKNTFRLFSWIEGTELIQVIDQLSTKEQYSLGFRAGEILREIHQVQSPGDRPSWGGYFNKKIEDKIAKYKHCGITIPNSDKLLAYIEAHRILLKDRPQCFHHGDFHLGNMLLSPNKELGIIDFNRLDFGDPWEEFNRISWTAEKSVYFANGQINGYFNNLVPPGFFELLALYIGVNQISSIPWAIPFGEKEVKVMLRQAKQVFEWFDDFNQSRPKWYRPTGN